MSRRLFLLPRWSGTADGDFYVELGRVAKEHGFTLHALLPESGLNPPHPSDVFALLNRELKDARDEDVIMGHSVGCQLWLRFLALPEAARLPRMRLLCVAGWFHVDDAKVWPALVPFLQNDVNWTVAAERVRSVVLFVSDNDPFTSDYKANIERWHERLGLLRVAPVVVPGAAHFNRSSEPELLRFVAHALRRPQTAFEPMPLLPSGRSAAHRMALAPLTNCQSFEDGTLSDDEMRWLTMRAAGGFSMVLTTASHVHESGKAFSGQLGVFSDAHVPRLSLLAAGIRERGALGIVQLHHGGARADFATERIAAVAADRTRAMTTAEVVSAVEWFVAAAARAEAAGFDGVEVHGAHGYLVTSFLSTFNTRDDGWGGSLDQRARFLFEIVKGIRQRCRRDFVVGVRLSMERYGVELPDMVEVSRRLCSDGLIDFLDLSAWDFAKRPEQEGLRWRSLLAHFVGAFDRRHVRVGVAGKIQGAGDVQACLEMGCDFVLIGRSGVVHHDFPERVRRDPAFERTHPATDEGLRQEGVSERFLAYLHRQFAPLFTAGKL